MSKQLVIFGATGNQGISAINCILNDAELSKQWKIRAVCRDTSKPAAQDLKQKGIDVVSADLEDAAAVQKAVQGADTIYLISITVREENGSEIELAQAKRVVDASIEAGAKYIILSGMTDVTKLTNGKLSRVEHFDVKAHIEYYIRDSSIKASYIHPASFMDNFSTVMGPRPVGDGTFAINNIFNPDTKLPLIDIPDDSGKWVTAILADQDKYEGKVLRAATGEYTLQEIADTISMKTGKTVKYNQIPDDVYKGFLPPPFAEQYLQMSQLFRDYNYYGPDQTELVEWSAQQARGKLTTYEEYLDRYPIKLE